MNLGNVSFQLNDTSKVLEQSSCEFPTLFGGRRCPESISLDLGTSLVPQVPSLLVTKRNKTCGCIHAARSRRCKCKALDRCTVRTGLSHCVFPLSSLDTDKAFAVGAPWMAAGCGLLGGVLTGGVGYGATEEPVAGVRTPMYPHNLRYSYSVARVHLEGSWSQPL